MSGPYVSTAELVRILGAGADSGRADVAGQAATDWIDAATGDTFVDPVPARIHQLALNAALRFYHDPEAPYGIIAASSDIPMYMRRLMVDADPLLLGLRVEFGIG